MTRFSNIGYIDRTVRYLAGGVLLAGVLLFLFPPALTFIATYAVLTAIVGWEPAYAFLSSMNSVAFHWVKKIAPQFTQTPQYTQTRVPAHG